MKIVTRPCPSVISLKELTEYLEDQARQFLDNAAAKAAPVRSGEGGADSGDQATAANEHAEARVLSNFDGARAREILKNVQQLRLYGAVRCEDLECRESLERCHLWRNPGVHKCDDCIALEAINPYNSQQTRTRVRA